MLKDAEHLQVKSTLPVQAFNFDSLKAWADGLTKHYAALVVTGMAYFGCSSPGLIDKFQELFFAAFEPLRIAPRIGAFDNCGAGEPGRRFLTKVFTGGVRDGGYVFDADNRVTVRGGEDELSGKNLLPADCVEINAGIRAGKEVVKLSMRLEDSDANVWTFTCNPALQVSGLKMPPAGAKNGERLEKDAVILEEAYLLEKLFSALFQACKENFHDYH